jgi:hypothetical protein
MCPRGFSFKREVVKVRGMGGLKKKHFLSLPIRLLASGSSFEISINFNFFSPNLLQLK